MGRGRGVEAIEYDRSQRRWPVADDQRRCQFAARSRDFVIVVVFLPVVLLIAAVIAFAIKLDSPGPVVYRSRRIGRGGVPFDMLKFRKMCGDAAGSPLTAYEDERFTPIGRFLMLTKLDELPQIWNVMRGEMRLVGPRPEVPEFVARHRESYDEILSISPGITGVSQLVFAAEARVLAGAVDPVQHYQDELLPAKIAFDIGYVRHRSMRGDLVLLIRTMVLPARRLGSHAYDIWALGSVEVLLAVVAVLALVISFTWASDL